MENGIISFIIAAVFVAIVVFVFSWLENEPDIIFKDSNVYEYNEFMTSGEASELGLEGGIGNYFKYTGDYEIEINFLKLEDILSYEISVELIDTTSINILIHSESIENPSSLTIVSQIPQTDFFDEDFEEAKLTITVIYLDRKGNEVEYSTTKTINIDEDFF